MGYSIAVSNWSKSCSWGKLQGKKCYGYKNPIIPMDRPLRKMERIRSYSWREPMRLKLNMSRLSGSIKGYAGFHDYNVSIESRNPDGVHGNLSTQKVGINNSVRASQTTRIGVGIGGNGNAQIRHGYSGNANVAGSVRTGIPKNSMSNNRIVFNYQDPGLFDTNDIMTQEKYRDGSTVSYYAKKYLPNYQLEFERSGDTYTLSSVYDESGSKLADGLENIRYTCDAWDGKQKIIFEFILAPGWSELR